MAKDSYSTAFGYGRWAGLARLIATFLSGKNADGSDHAVPVSISGGVEINAETLELQTDTLEASLSSIDGKIPANPATSAKQDTQSGKLDTLISQTDGLEGFIDGVEALLTAISGKLTGAANYANSQVTAGVASAQLVAARATRRSVLIRNTDATNSAYIGAGTVTSGNGFLLKAGESVSIDTTAAINCIRDTADVALAVFETYDA